MPAIEAKKPPRLLVKDLVAGANVSILPEEGYSDCVVLIPNADAGGAAGSNYLAVLFVNRVGLPNGVPYTVPNSADCCVVHMNGFFTPKGEIEVALESAGKPGPPVIIK